MLAHRAIVPHHPFDELSLALEELLGRAAHRKADRMLEHGPGAAAYEGGNLDVRPHQHMRILAPFAPADAPELRQRPLDLIELLSWRSGRPSHDLRRHRECA